MLLVMITPAQVDVAEICQNHPHIKIAFVGVVDGACSMITVAEPVGLQQPASESALK